MSWSFLLALCVAHAKPPPEAAWAESQGLPRIIERTERHTYVIDGMPTALVDLVHKGGAQTRVLTLGSGGVIGPLAPEPLVYVPESRAGLVAVRPADEAQGYLLVDAKSGSVTPTRTGVAKTVSTQMVVLTTPDDRDDREAIVLGPQGIVWQADGLAPGASVTFEAPTRPAALVATRGGLLLFDNDGNTLLSLTETCPARFIQVGNARHVSLDCDDGTKVVAKTGDIVWPGRDGLVFQQTIERKAHDFVDPQGRHHLLPLDLQGKGTVLPSAPRALARMWGIPVDAPEGAPEAYRLLDPRSLAPSTPPVIVRPLTDACRGSPERPMHLRPWCFGEVEGAAPIERGVFLESQTPQGPRWGLVDKSGKVLRGPVWLDVRVVPIDVASGGLANHYGRLTRSLFLVQDAATRQWIRILPNGLPEEDARPHASAEEAVAQAKDEITTYHWARSKDPEAARQDIRHRDLRQYADKVMTGDVHGAYGGAVGLASIIGDDMDTRYDEDGLIRRAMNAIATRKEPLTAHQWSNLHEAAALLETTFDGAPGPLTAKVAALHEDAVAKDTARDEAAREAELERIRKGIGWQEPSEPITSSTSSYSASTGFDCSWCGAVVAQQQYVQNQEFQRWVDSVDAFLGK